MFNAPPGSTGRRAARRLVVTGAVAALTVGMAACGGSGGSGAPAAAKAPDASALDKAGGVTKVTFWHAMDGTNAEVLTKLVDAFNKANAGKIQVEATYVGQVRRRDRQVQGLDPEQVHPRRRAGLRHRHPVHDRRRADRADAGLHRPRQGRHERPAAEHRRLLLGGQEALLDAVQHLDAGAVHQREAVQGGRARPGQAADHARRRSAPRPRSCRRRTAARPTTASAPPSTAGCSSSSSPQNGEEYCDQGNGRDGKATKVNFDGDTSVAVVAWWQKMVKDGLAANTGRDTKAAQAAFKSGQLAMTPGVHRPGRGFQEAAKAGGFGLGVANYPQAQAGRRRRPDHRRRLAVDRRRRPQRRPEGSRPGSS